MKPAPPRDLRMTSCQWCTTAKMHSVMAMGQQLSPKTQSTRMLLVKDWTWVTWMFMSWTTSTNAVSALSLKGPTIVYSSDYSVSIQCEHNVHKVLNPVFFIHLYRLIQCISDALRLLQSEHVSHESLFM